MVIAFFEHPSCIFILAIQFIDHLDNMLYLLLRCDVGS
jgi:hypothetical protein